MAQQLKICLTGGTAGIGHQLCKNLVSEGHSVLVLCRTLERFQQALKGLEPQHHHLVQPVVCDVGCLASVRSAAAEITRTTQHLDALVLNAGVMNTRLKTTAEGYEETLATNHLGQFLLAHELLPLLLKAQVTPARVVLVSSELHKRALPDQAAALFQYSPACAGSVSATPEPPPFKGMQAYSLSKLFNVWTGQVLAQRAGSKLWVASVSPGFVPSTSLSRDNSWWARLAMRWIVTWAPFAVTVEEGAWRVLQVTTDASAPSDAPSGTYWARRKPAPGGPLTQETAAAQQVWDTTMKVLGLSDFLGPPSVTQ